MAPRTNRSRQPPGSPRRAVLDGEKGVASGGPLPRNSQGAGASAPQNASTRSQTLETPGNPIKQRSKNQSSRNFKAVQSSSKTVQKSSKQFKTFPRISAGLSAWSTQRDGGQIAATSLAASWGVPRPGVAVPLPSRREPLIASNPEKRALPFPCPGRPNEGQGDARGARRGVMPGRASRFKSPAIHATRAPGADVAEPVDARDLKSLGPKAVRVRPPPSAPGAGQTEDRCRDGGRGSPRSQRGVDDRPHPSLAPPRLAGAHSSARRRRPPSPQPPANVP